MSRSIAVYYEHPEWLKPLFRELGRRGVLYREVHAASHFEEMERFAAEVLPLLEPTARPAPFSTKRPPPAVARLTRHAQQAGIP